MTGRKEEYKGALCRANKLCRPAQGKKTVVMYKNKAYVNASGNMENDGNRSTSDAVCVEKQERR